MLGESEMMLEVVSAVELFSTVAASPIYDEFCCETVSYSASLTENPRNECHRIRSLLLLLLLLLWWWLILQLLVLGVLLRRVVSDWRCWRVDEACSDGESNDRRWL